MRTRMNHHVTGPLSAASRIGWCSGVLLSLVLSMPARGDDASPPGEAAKPEERSVWMAEDSTFPRRLAVAPYVGGVPDGEARFYVPTGGLCMIDHYKAGVIDGERTEYYPSGARFVSCSFVNGRASGPMLQWYPDGTLFSSIEFRDGVVSGGFTQYFRNGRPAMESQVVDGLAQGQRRHYLPDGRLLGVTSWVDGSEVGRRTYLQPSQADFDVISDLVNWAGLKLKDLWAE